MKSLLLGIFVILATQNLLQAQPQNQDVQALTVESFFHIWQSTPTAVVLDTRLQKNYRRLHIPGAINVADKTTLYQTLDTLGYDQPMLIYCDHKQRAQTVAQLISDAGFQQIFYLKQGFYQWQQMKYPTERMPWVERIQSFFHSE